MGSTFASLYNHIVFSTKDRRPWLTGDLQRDLHRYLDGTIQGLNAHPEAIGGVEDHVHLLIRLRPTRAPAEMVRELKKASNAWLREKVPTFAWQEGYAIFSVGSNGLPAVKKYIAGQEDHHRVESYLDELKRFLEEAGVEYDDRFLV